MLLNACQPTTCSRATKRGMKFADSIAGWIGKKLPVSIVAWICVRIIACLAFLDVDIVVRENGELCVEGKKDFVLIVRIQYCCSIPKLIFIVFSLVGHKYLCCDHQIMTKI